MKCLIIAAGKGQRLQKEGASKPLIPLFGVALLERTILSAREAGADAFYVVTGAHHDRVDAFLARLAQRLQLPVHTIFNTQWQDTDNGVSVLSASQEIHEPFLLLMTDHVFDPSIARNLIQSAHIEHNSITLAVDYQLDNPLIDLDDVTRVHVEDGKISAIGKGIKAFNAYDTGIFLCTPAIFDALQQVLEETGNAKLSTGVQLLAVAGQAGAFDIDGRFWIDVDDPVSFWRAENALLSQQDIDTEMNTLFNKQCAACRVDAPQVTQEEIPELLSEIPDWALIHIDGINRLQRIYTFSDFIEALAFTNSIGAIAEQEAHHPAILTEWGKVTVTWWTHKIKGLHINDFIMAAKTDQLLSVTCG